MKIWLIINPTFDKIDVSRDTGTEHDPLHSNGTKLILGEFAYLIDCERTVVAQMSHRDIK